MANAIPAKFFTGNTITITIASVASSTSGAGQQGDIVSNTTNRYTRIHVYAQIKLGTSPSGNRGVYFYFIKSDGTVRTDGASASAGSLTMKNADCVYGLNTGASPATGDVLTGDFEIDNPGPEWTIAFYHDTGVNLDSTAGNHTIRWVGEYPEIQ